MTLFRIVRRFVAQTRGGSAVEFALVASPFFVLILGIAENGLDFYCRSSLDVAAQHAARQIQVGAVQQGNLDGTGFRTLACTYLPSFMPCANLVFNVQTVGATSGSTFYDLTTALSTANGVTQYALKQPSLNQAQNQFCPGQSNQYVVVQFLYTVPVVTGIWLTSTAQVNGRSVRVISAAQVLRNEAFTASNTGAGC